MEQSNKTAAHISSEIVENGANEDFLPISAELKKNKLYLPIAIARLYLGTLSIQEFKKEYTDIIKLKNEELRLIELHKLSAIYRQVVLSNKACFSQQLNEYFQEKQNRLFQKKLLQLAEINRIQKEFAKHGVKVLPYKGICLGKEFYKDINQRDNADIDFAINVSHLPISNQVMTKLGYKESKGKSNFEQLEKSRSYYVDYEWWLVQDGEVKHCVEYHWQPGFSALYCPHTFDTKLENSIVVNIENQQVETFSKVEHALIILIHHGMVDGWGELRHLVDLVKIIESISDTELHQLVLACKKNKIYRFYCLGITLAKVLLGYNNPVVKLDILKENKVKAIIKSIENQSIVGDWSKKPKKLYFYLQHRDTFLDTLRSFSKFGIYALKEIQFKFEQILVPPTMISPSKEKSGINITRKLSTFSNPKIKYKNDWFTHLIPLWEYFIIPIKNIHQPQILEIGSYEGLSACWLIENIIKPSKGHITCVDIRFQPNFKHNIQAIKGKKYLTKYKADSRIILDTLPKNYYDLIYIDGSHTEEQVKIDISLSWPLLKIGGLLVFDDYGHKVDLGVKAAVDIFIENNQEEIQELHKVYQCILKKIPSKKLLYTNEMKRELQKNQLVKTTNISSSFGTSNTAQIPKILLICANERTGSSLLGLSLASIFEISGGMEFFKLGTVSTPYVFKNFETPTIAQVEDFINRLKIKFIHSKVICIKLVWNQYRHYLNRQIDLISCISPDYLIHLSRKDRLLQAISLKIAIDEQAFSANDEKKKESYFDYLKIKAFKEKAEYFDQQIKERLTKELNPIYACTYEQLTNNFNGTLKNIISFLNIQTISNIESITPPLKKQGNQKNIEWKARYLKEEQNEISIATKPIITKKGDYIGIYKNGENSTFTNPAIQYENDWFSHLIPLWEYHLLPLKLKEQSNFLIVGAVEGLATCWLVLNILKHNNGNISCIDAHFTSNFNHNIKTIKGEKYLSRLTGIHQQMLTACPTESYDLIYINHGKSENQVAKETKLSWALLKQEGLLVFNDYGNNNYKGIKTAVDHFVSKFRATIEIKHIGYQYILKKTKNPNRNQEKFAEYKETIGIHKVNQWSSFSNPSIQYTKDWFTSIIPSWEKFVLPAKQKAKAKILEIGSFEGLSACWLIENILKHNKGHITCIDIKFQSNFDHNIKAIGGEKYVTKKEGDSTQILPNCARDYYDFIYIDGGHTEEQVSVDAQLSWPLLKEGGILVFDDYEYVHDLGVKKAVNQFVDQFRQDMQVLHIDYQYIIQKKVGSEVK